MFSVQRSFFSGSWRSSLLFSATIFLLFIILFAGVLVVVRMSLIEYCRNDSQLRLEGYIQSMKGGEFSFEGDINPSEQLQGLDFIRIIFDKEEFFLSRGSVKDLNFQNIVNQDPSGSAVWVALDNHKSRPYWVIASQMVEGGITVQGGKTYPEIVQLYQNVQKGLLLLIVPALLMAMLAGVYCHLANRRSIGEAERALNEILEKGTNELLQIEQKSELTKLYRLLNSLISQNRQLVEEMRDSLDNVAHDLRTPMTRLRSVAEYGLRENTPEQLGEALSDCLEESEKLLSMLNIMMSVVEAESGTMRMAVEDVDLLKMITEVINLYEYVAEDKGITFQMDIPAHIVIYVDRIRMRQVWANLIDNGIKYGRQGGFLNISAHLSGEMIVVVFEDNGMGISPVEQQRIWERLFRGDRSRTQPGLGLGLNYVRAVVEAHGGEVRVRSDLQKGARFEVRLPHQRKDLARTTGVY